MFIDVSEKHTAPIFRLESKRLVSSACFFSLNWVLGLHFHPEAGDSMLLLDELLYQTKQRHIPETVLFV
jgi:hypothetical protein